MDIQFKWTSDVVDILTNVVQKREFEFNVESDQKKYLGRWEVIYWIVYRGIINRSNYLALKLNLYV
jgi:hypothetical protein